MRKLGSIQLEVKIKKLNENAVIPAYTRLGDAGLDLTACTEKVRNEITGPLVEYGTGISIQIPEGYVGLIFPRSSLTTKTTLMLGNSVGVIDSNYRGEILFQFRHVNPSFGKKYNVGDRIGQLIIMPYPYINFKEVEELDDSNRGSEGFGSSGS